LTHPKLFFILGCQRSGTTLMRYILESHSQISCIDEYRGYSLLQTSELLNQELQKNSHKKYIGFKLPRITEQLLNSILTDVDIDFHAINNFKNTQLIFMVRNIFDVVSSMKTLIDQNNMWIKTWPEKWLTFWMEKNPTLMNEYELEIDYWKNSKQKNVVAAAIMWKIKTLSLQKYKKEQMNVLPVSYEDLVINKINTIHHVLDFLDLSWEDSVLSHEKASHVEVDEHGIGIGNNDSTKPIFTKSVNKYSQILTDDEISEITKIVPENQKLISDLIGTKNSEQ